ncbi:MAG: aminomethyl-transferring glycine dehydrogenase subunit GcvPA [Coriobacteriia bacterium]|nr:aminomethyl-transferring glycine dehydrogenase subunit GcvPA [Coriobacteriia bacterium]
MSRLDYRSITDEQRAVQLNAIGVASCNELIADIPSEIRLHEALAIEGGMDEIALVCHVGELAAENKQLVCFAGGGCYDHHIPAFIDHIVRRPEFFTAYTPYQPEASQGTLQAIYEYQTAMCRLTAMAVSNASMYDGATALAEAALMAVRHARGKRPVVVAAETLNPQYLEVLTTYAQSGLMQTHVASIEKMCAIGTDSADGVVDSDTVAAILIGYPNYYGIYENVAKVVESAHAIGALAIVCANPLLLALGESPGVLGADIVCGEAQCFGSPMSFGGPGLGYLCATERLMRLMPGRIVGRTCDADGADGFVLTLATREQHIRREKATSNICSNHALNALAAGAYLTFHGADGLAAVAQRCVEGARSLYERLIATDSFAPFNISSVDTDEASVRSYEFAVRYTGPGSLAELYDTLVVQGILPGIVVADDVLLVAVTERRNAAELDRFVEGVNRYAASAR